MKKFVKFSVFIVMVLFICGCNKELNENEIEQKILEKLTKEYSEEFKIDKIVKTDSGQSCLVSQCGYRAWVTNEENDVSFVIHIERDGNNFSIENDVNADVEKYLNEKYNEKFKIINIKYNQCSSKLDTDWIEKYCEYGIIVSPINSTDNTFDVGYSSFGGYIIDDYKD